MSLFGIGSRYYRPFKRSYSRNVSIFGSIMLGRRRSKTISWKTNRRYKYSPYNRRRLHIGV